MLLLIAVTGLLPSCSGKSLVDSSPGESSAAEIVTSSIPPFKTREPERYSATRIVTANDDTAAGSPANVTRSSTTLIARDGANRREEYESVSGERIVYLETAAGSFVLLASVKMYADLNGGAAGGLVEVGKDTTDTLLDQVRGEATYQKLGAEQLSERRTTKYRVRYAGLSKGTATIQETFIWVDEDIHMPIRSETNYVNAGRSSKVTMELRDIKLDVDQRAFELPQDYRKVESKKVLDRLRDSR